MNIRELYAELTIWKLASWQGSALIAAVGFATAVIAHVLLSVSLTYVYGTAVVLLLQIPGLILFAQYYSLDKNKRLTRDEETVKLSIGDTVVLKHQIRDIDWIVVRGAAHPKKGVQLFNYQNMFYILVRLRNGMLYSVTSILGDRIELFEEFYNKKEIEYEFELDMFMASRWSLNENEKSN